MAKTGRTLDEILTNSKPAMDEPATPATLPAAKVAVSAGDDVRVVTAAKESLPAKVIGVRGFNKVDLEFELNGAVETITSAPFDPTKQRPDSWHLPNT